MNKRQQQCYEKVKGIVEGKGGVLLTDSFDNISTQMTVKCSNDHIWTTAYYNLTRDARGKIGTWCPKCLGLAKLTLEDIQKDAREKGGECLATFYTDSVTPIPWKCSQGHMWITSASSIRSGSWCPHCYGNAKLTIETLKAIAIEKGGECLEDTYVNNTHPMKWKCGEGHIWTSIAASIREGSWCVKCYHQNRKIGIDAMKEFAKTKRGKCLSEIYIDNNTRLWWECEAGHQWEALPRSVYHGGHWCVICSGTAKLTIGLLKAFAITKEGECLSDDYLNNRKYLSWKCKEGHTWEAKAAHVYARGQWCPRCCRSPPLYIEDMHKAAEERNGKFLSETYTTGREKHLWQCDRGHIFLMRPSSIINDGKWCKYCSWSKGERECNRILVGELNIVPIPQYHIVDDDKNTQLYDFFFIHDNTRYILEYDGEQHFDYVEYFHRTQETYAEKREIDIIKTRRALKLGIRVIRIDSLQFKRVEYHIKEALQMKLPIYFSNSFRYGWIINGIRDLVPSIGPTLVIMNPTPTITSNTHNIVNSPNISEEK